MQKHYHLIGIGGIGMSGIAKLLLQANFRVSGSDLYPSKATEELVRLGAKVFIGHNGAYLSDVDAVVYSSAIKENNPEIIEAKKQGICLIKRAEALAQLMKEKKVIAVSGSHGKTTTTSLISHLLFEAGLKPTVAIGGILRNIDNNVYSGSGEYFVAEADESDGSFLYYEPTYSIVTNIDREHLDYYKVFENELDTFRQFFNKTKSNGCLYYCADDSNIKNIISGYKNSSISYGLREKALVRPQHIEFKELTCEFDCIYKDKFIERFYLALGGLHNISNALSVIALGLDLGLDKQIIKKALSNFKGTRRRLEVKFKNEDYTIIDDYAHHPSELKATLSAIGNLKRRRLIAIFQPHRFTRTKLLLEEFATSFYEADIIIITDIYAANEKPIEGVSAEALYEKIKIIYPRKEVIYLAKEKIREYVLKSEVRLIFSLNPAI
ncbi:MAG: UDP-N-acetylmuramate--L-alanine ligase [Candidatus Omnitrophica bacterium]|nr:UDP-N-acetylmuramate--L-alanine ligase [Candidatus Omnitrophota bacterium]